MNKIRSIPFSQPGYTIGRVLLFYTVSVVILLFTSRLAKELPAKVAEQFSMLLASVLTFLLIFLFAKWERIDLTAVGVIPGGKSIKRFVGGYAIGLTMAVMQALIVLTFGNLRLNLNSHLSISEFSSSSLLFLLVACREELAFRSYALRSLNYVVKSVPALLIITVIFVCEHVLAGMSWKMAIIGSGLGGALFGASALKTKGLALPFGLHSAWNFGQWMMGFKNKPGVWQAVVEKGYEARTENIGLAAFALAMILAILGIFIFYKGEKMDSPAPGSWKQVE